MYKKRSTFDMKQRSFYTTHLLYDSVQLTASEDSLRRVQFSHFIDSVPYTKYDVRKNKNGRVTRVKVTKNDINRDAYKRRKDLIADYDFLPGMDRIHYVRKNDDLRLIKMEDQYISPEDSVQFLEQGSFLAEDFADGDSLATPLIEEPPTEVYRFGYGFGAPFCDMYLTTNPFLYLLNETSNCDEYPDVRFLASTLAIE